MNKGFSIVEVMLAVALFMIFATGMVVAVISGLNNNQLAGEQTIANQYASEGLEAARGLGFNNVANTNSVFDKYSRSLVVTSIDADTKKVTSAVSWNVNSARANSVVLTTYLTNWRAGAVPSTCVEYCVSLGNYTTGTCRQNKSQCTKYHETYESGGDQYCLPLPPADSCCCQ
ncbi:MAG: type II secretion system protein [Patescibacteria group bacterium]